MTVRLCLFGRLLVSLNCASKNGKKHFLPAPLSTCLQIKTLKSVVGKPKDDLPKPEENLRIKETKILSDNPTEVNEKKRPRSTYDILHENSKIIIVDGTLATNKTEFAKKLAHEFGMDHIPDASEESYFHSPELDYDIRAANEVLPDGKKFINLETFYSSSDPKNVGIVRTQALISRRRMQNYLMAVCQVLNTGQGVVLDRCVFSDLAYAVALFSLKYINKEDFKIYIDLYNLMVSKLLRPHVFVYLSAPVEHVKNQIKKRGIPYEVNSKVLSDHFLLKLNKGYREAVFPRMNSYCEILEYDASNLPDWKHIVEDIEKLDMTYKQESKFKDWNNRDLDEYRVFIEMYDVNFDFWSKFLPRFWGVKDGDEYILKIRQCVLNRIQKNKQHRQA